MYNFRSILSIAFAICSLNLSAQEINTEIYGKKMNTFIDIEKKLGGKLYQGEGDMIVPGGMAVPLTFRRAERGIPDLLVTYTFSKQDSLIDRIEYEWDMINFEPSNKKQTLDVQKSFVKKYELLVNQLNQKYGERVHKGDLNELAKIDLKGGLTRNDKWKPNDSLTITLYTVLSNFYEKKGDIKIEPTNRIRLYVNKIKKNTNPELSDEAIAAAKKSYDQFILKLRAGDLEGAKTSFSAQIRNQITETVFKQLKDGIKPEPFKVYMQGLQNVNGTNYLMIQYAYESAPEEPNEIIRVLFDKEHLIIGIQPLVRKAKVN
ncbi:hypothetical protein [Pedobacter sp. MC2016-24]|uniref:hypothetical protein n=1 Tax=Pedobacter sp. MC2016-24 TaxID=2780090 RepID=UPI00187F6C28|nr:hypothetical protein [Pedobacter sp. MC2016-24]MBE9603188.1 hypothetical protein [Pedobacter sp. MC2016-24]